MANPDITIFDENDTGSSTEPPTEIMEDGFVDGYIPPATDHNFLFKQNQKGLQKSRNDGVWDWEDPSVNTDITYSIGSIVRHANRTWISKVNTNTGEPGVAGWFLAPRQELETRTSTHNMASDANYTLTEPQNSYGRVIITDSGVVLTTGRDIIVDDNERSFFVLNSTAQILTFKTAAGTGIAINAGDIATLLCDGTNVIYAVAPATNIALVCSGYLATSVTTTDTVINWSETLDTDNAMVSGVFTITKNGKHVIVANQTHVHSAALGYCACLLQYDGADIGKMLTQCGNNEARHVATSVAVTIHAVIGKTIQFKTHGSLISATHQINGGSDRLTDFSIFYIGE